MKQQIPSPAGSISNRRAFLRSAGLLALATPVAAQATRPPLPPPSQWWHGHGALQLAAEGKVPLPFVLPPMPADPNDPDPHADMSVLYPMPGTRDTLLIEFSIDVPNPDKPGEWMVVTISHLEVNLEDVVFGCEPTPTFLLAGRVGKKSVSPFGNLVGMVASLSGAFTVAPGGAVTFQFLAASVAGSHTSIAPQAAGTFKWRR